MTIPISVVIPAYNRADLIGETINSILGQSAPPAEVIVVDDGSRDGTADALSGFGGRITVLRIPNSGELVARNTGIRHASGQLIAFCDSDDLWRPDHLAEMQALWVREPSLTAAYANFHIVRDGVWLKGEKYSDHPPGFWDRMEVLEPGRFGVFRQQIIRELIDFQPFFPSAMVVKTDAFRALGGWDEGVNRWMGQDFATALRVAEHPPIGVVLTPTVGIRKHEGNFSGDVQRMILGDATILEHVLRTRSSLAPHADAIGRSILARRADALEIAFSRQDFTAVVEITGLVGEGQLPQRARLKARLARLPGPLRRVVVPALLGLGTLRARLRQG